MNDKELITSDQKLLQVNPDVSRDEQLDFINAYRNMQAANTDEINTQTRALGTDITPAKGGLTGVGSYLATRYQQPQTEAAVATLRTAAQQAALNQALQNYQANLQEQYNQAYRKYSRAAARRSSSGDGRDSSKAKSPNITTDTGNGNKQTTVDENPNTGARDIQQNVNGTKTLGSLKLASPGTAFMSLVNQGASLGVWPDGSRLTEGSRYSRGGKTYTYVTADNTPYASFYEIIGG